MRKTSVTFILLISSVAFSFGQTEKSVNNINGGMPNRISMNVTVPKQTQGATFGEKVKVSVVEGDCVVLFPNKQAFRVNSSRNTVTEMGTAESSKVNAGLHTAGGALAQGASLLGGALPGGAIISAALLSSETGGTVWTVKDVRDEFQIPSDLPDGKYELTVNLDAGSKDVAKKVIRFSISVTKRVLQVNSARSSN